MGSEMDTDFEDECRDIVRRRKEAGERLKAIDKAIPKSHSKTPGSPSKMQDFLAIVSTACQVCKSTGDDDAMLLCDGCDHGYHTYCHQPPIEDVPEGDWYCPACSAEGGPKERRTPNSGSAGRKKPFRKRSAWSRGVAKKKTKKKILVGSDAEEKEKEGDGGEEEEGDVKKKKEDEEEQRKHEEEENGRNEQEEKNKRREDEPKEREEEAMSSPRTSRRGTASSTTADQGPSTLPTQAADLAPSVPTGVRIDSSRVIQWHNDLVRTTEGFVVEKLERIYTAMAKVIRQYRFESDRTALPTDLQAGLEVLLREGSVCERRES